VFAVLCFFPYINVSADVDCGDLNDNVCIIIKTVANWSGLMVNFIISGTPLIALTSIGNGGTADKLSEQIHGLFWVLGLVVMPGFMLEFNYLGFANKIATNEPLVRAQVITFIALGCLLAGYKLIGIWRISVLRSHDKGLRTHSTTLQYFTNWNARDERYSKRAAVAKIQAFMDNAISLHYNDSDSKASDSDTQSGTSHSITDNKFAIVKYEKNQDKGETIGGMLWTWKLFFTHELHKIHGVRFNARLIIGVAAVFIWLVLASMSSVTVYKYINDLYESSDDDSSFNISDIEWTPACNGTFHADSCASFPNPDSDGAVICSQIYLNYESIQDPGWDTCTVVSFMNVGRLLSNHINVTGVEDEQTYDNTTGPEGDQTHDNTTELDEEQAYDNATSWIELAVNSFYSEYTSSFSETALTYEEFIEELSLYGVFEPALQRAPAFASNAQCHGIIDYCIGTPDNFTFSSSNQEKVWAGVCVLGINNEFQGTECDMLGDPIANSTSFLNISDLLQQDDDEESFSLDYFLSKEAAITTYATSICLVVIWLLYLVLSYLPSASTVILMYRYGLLPSLKEGKRFWKLRGKGHESSTYLMGAIIWGALYSSTLIFFVSLIVLIFTFSKVTRDIVIYLVAWTAGITLTVMGKIIIVAMLAPRVFAKNHVYRDRPFTANIVILALECWGFGVTAGYLLVRVCKLLGVALFYVGRIDQVMLADDLLGDMLDKYPIYFRKDLLSHEAHRHPYIERLGVVYMLKLLLDDKGEFCNGCGTSWRLVLLHAIMPWLFKRRVHLKSEVEDLMGGDEVKMYEKEEGGVKKNQRKTILGRWNEALLKNNEL